MKKLLLTFFVAIMVSSSAFSQWTEIHYVQSGVYNFDGMAVQYTSTNILYTMNRTAVYKSTNGGYNWTLKYENTNLNLRNMFFVNDNVGFVVGTQCVLKTSNGGDTWTVVYDNYAELNGAYFFNANVGYVYGDEIMLSTTNGGTSWNENTLDFIGNYLHDMHFFDATNGLLATYNGIYRTDDGGSNWSETSGSLYMMDIEEISIVNSTTAIIAGPYGVLAKTTNAGLSWFSLSNEEVDWEHVYFLTGSKGFLSCSSGLYYTTDAGANTYAVTGLHCSGINTTSFIDEYHGCEVGAGLYITDCGGITTMENEAMSSGLIVYPNPTKDKFSLTISDEFAGQSFVIKIFDYTGKEVFVSDYSNNDFLSFDLQSYEKGIYLLKVISDKGTITKQIVKE